MTLGDGIRRNVATVSQDERNKLRDAFIALNNKFYKGDRDESPPGHVSYWFKQDEIHHGTHVHHGPAFLPWHREITNRFEALLREAEPLISLHYWDWTSNPTPLFTSNFMGNANGDAGDPWLKNKFYKPDAQPFRDDILHLPPDPHGENQNPADYPRTLRRFLGQNAPPRPTSLEDKAVIEAKTYPDMRIILEDIHDNAHVYIGGIKDPGSKNETRGTIANLHTAFRDPFVFLLHSNVDRLFALWQLQPGHEWRLDPNQIYGSESNTQASGEEPNVQVGILSPLEPWAGSDAPDIDNTLLTPVRPWAPPEDEQFYKNSKHPSVVAPPCYDTNPPHRRSVVKALTTRQINLPTNLRPVAANLALVPPISISSLICRLGDGYL